MVGTCRQHPRSDARGLLEAGGIVEKLIVFRDKCRHFTGIQHKACAAGVPYVDVRDSSQPGPYRWPCLDTGRGTGGECKSLALMTQEEHAAAEAELQAIVDKALADIASGKCHECGAPIEPSRIVGRCKYAACGHRVGQVATGEDE
jgi:hypothetical protein